MRTMMLIGFLFLAGMITATHTASMKRDTKQLDFIQTNSEAITVLLQNQLLLSETLQNEEQTQEDSTQVRSSRIREGIYQTR